MNPQPEYKISLFQLKKRGSRELPQTPLHTCLHPVSNHTKTSFPSKAYSNTDLLFRYEGPKQAPNSLNPVCKLSDKLLAGHFRMISLVYGSSILLPWNSRAITHMLTQCVPGPFWGLGTRLGNMYEMPSNHTAHTAVILWSENKAQRSSGYFQQALYSMQCWHSVALCAADDAK